MSLEGLTQSGDKEMARTVGARHGSSVVLVAAAQRMNTERFAFSHRSNPMDICSIDASRTVELTIRGAESHRADIGLTS
jgi:RNA:NAD 2'-phosphotransferase (TPT1/KptA family)